MGRPRPDHLSQVFLLVLIWGEMVMVLCVLCCRKLVTLLNNEVTVLPEGKVITCRKGT